MLNQILFVLLWYNVHWSGVEFHTAFDALYLQNREQRTRRSDDCLGHTGFSRHFAPLQSVVLSWTIVFLELNSLMNFICATVKKT